MIKPAPHKLKCSKCGYRKIVSPKSDVVDPGDFVQKCQKCDTFMEKTSLSTTESLLAKLFKRQMMRTLILVVVLLLFFTLLKSAFKKRAPLNTQLLISMMSFGGIGFAIGNHYGLGWATFGVVFGLLLGIELKEKLFQVVHMVYKDILEKQGEKKKVIF